VPVLRVNDRRTSLERLRNLFVDEGDDLLPFTYTLPFGDAKSFWTSTTTTAVFAP
jgi:hypothetical protein